MPTIDVPNGKIHFEVSGSGPALVMHHGMFCTGDIWTRNGWVSRFEDRYRVILVDALGHGKSSKPTQRSAYTQELRAMHVAAVLDSLGVDAAHFLGHSMGGWVGVGMARFQTHRLRSLCIGGWSPVTGVAAALPPGIGHLPGKFAIAHARTKMPHLISWAGIEAEPGLAASWEALDELDGAEAALRPLSGRLLLFCGENDAFAPDVTALGAALQCACAITRGDHVSMIEEHGASNADVARSFIDEYEQTLG